MVPLLDPPLVDYSYGDSCLTRNDWICPKYYQTRSQILLDALNEHIVIVLASLALGLVLAVPLALLARRYRWLEGIIVGLTTAVYTIPSLALFSLLLPVTGINRRTVIIGLAVYSLTILVRAFLDGFAAVPAEVRESAVGMGYGAGRLLWLVEFPLALPTIISGLRVATVSTVALTTVGAILDSGGLGELILQGTATNFKAQVLAACVLCVGLAVALDLLLVILQRLLTPWTRTKRAVAA